MRPHKWIVFTNAYDARKYFFTRHTLRTALIIAFVLGACVLVGILLPRWLAPTPPLAPITAAPSVTATALPATHIPTLTATAMPNSPTPPFTSTEAPTATHIPTQTLTPTLTETLQPTNSATPTPTPTVGLITKPGRETLPTTGGTPQDAWLVILFWVGLVFCAWGYDAWVQAEGR